MEDSVVRTKNKREKNQTRAFLEKRAHEILLGALNPRDIGRTTAVHSPVRPSALELSANWRLIHRERPMVLLTRALCHRPT
jgi:hypothetical protein